MLLKLQITLMSERRVMVISEATVRPTDEAVEHPRMDWLRVDERMPWQADTRGLNH